MKAFHIREDKWHYKLHNIVRDPVNFIDPTVGDGWLSYSGVKKRHPRNLCRYFWSTVLSLALIVVLGIPIAIVAAVGISLLFAAFYISDKWKDRRWPRRKKKVLTYAEIDAQLNKEPKQPGMIRTFFKARKAKVCPLIIIDPVEVDYDVLPD